MEIAMNFGCPITIQTLCAEIEALEEAYSLFDFFRSSLA